MTFEINFDPTYLPFVKIEHDYGDGNHRDHGIHQKNPPHRKHRTQNKVLVKEEKEILSGKNQRLITPNKPICLRFVNTLIFPKFRKPDLSVDLGNHCDDPLHQCAVDRPRKVHYQREDHISHDTRFVDYEENQAAEELHQRAGHYVGLEAVAEDWGDIRDKTPEWFEDEWKAL